MSLNLCIQVIHVEEGKKSSIPNIEINRGANTEQALHSPILTKKHQFTSLFLPSKAVIEQAE